MLYPAVLLLLGILRMDNLWSCLMRMDLCTDLTGSGSWTLTTICVVALGGPDLCLQPARTTVPGVSHQLSVLSYFLYKLQTSAEILIDD